MTEHESWLANNNAYLAAALPWLRLRLGQLAQNGVGDASARTLPAQSTAGSGTSPSWARRFFGRQDVRAAELVQAPLALVPGPTAQAEQVHRAAEKMEQAAGVQPPPALVLLAQRLGLTRFEQELLLLCAGMELDTRVASLCAQAQDDPARPYPTYALALALSDQPSWDALSPHRPLRYWRLIEINQPGAQPLTTSALRADERIVSYLKGLNQLDDRVATLLAPDARFATGDLSLPPSQQAVADRLVRRMSAGMPPPVVQLAGADPESKRLIAAHTAYALGLSLCILPVEALPPHVGELETLARLWERESLLLPLALYVDAHELMRGSDATDNSTVTGLRRFLARSGGVVFVDVRDGLGDLGEREALTVDVAKPEPAEQRRVWETVLTDGARPMVPDLVGQFNLGLPAILRTVGDARAEAGDAPGALGGEVWRACLRFTRPRLEALAQYVEPKATLDSLVLPERERRKLGQIVEHVRWRSRVYNEFGLRETTNRGLGISVLFAGESGTGKTTAAEAIAIALQLNLFRIDLSAVVSKYIGETEKNLRKVFDAAEDGGAILLFDEADALFGKRSEVKDSHDRYANIEIGYLLQRMESYNGLAILTTNMKSSLDHAFLRRLRFVVDFPFPGQAERKVIWQRAFPPRVVLGADLDFERLARFNLSGGSIHNAAVHAAFLAAAQPDATVTMAMAVDAAQDELLRLNKPVQQV